jgi:hypothetical protein
MLAPVRICNTVLQKGVEQVDVVVNLEGDSGRFQQQSTSHDTVLRRLALRPSSVGAVTE